jgi:hypothetical protein
MPPVDESVTSASVTAGQMDVSEPEPARPTSPSTLPPILTRSLSSGPSCSSPFGSSDVRVGLDIEFTAFVSAAFAGPALLTTPSLPSSPANGSGMDVDTDAESAIVVKDVLMKTSGAPNGGLWPHMLHDAAAGIVPQVSAQQWNAYARYEVCNKGLL